MNELIPYNNYLKPAGELPKHITHNQYLKLREQPRERYKDKQLLNKRNDLLIARDTLLLDFAWETGGRIGDITRVKKEDYNFDDNLLNFRIKKTNRIIQINITNETIHDILKFYNKYNREPFEMTTSNAWYIVKKYGEMIDLKIHPHMLRHGLAMFLMSKQVNPAYITYRLGHSDIRTTMKFYARITPEFEKFALKDIDFRGKNEKH
jgi:integrase